MGACAGYLLCFVYLAISFGPLAFKRSNGKRREMRKSNEAKSSESRVKSTDISVVLLWLGCACFYAAVSAIIPLPTPPPFVAAHKKYRGSFFDQYHATPHKLSPAVADECVENDRL